MSKIPIDNMMVFGGKIMGKIEAIADQYDSVHNAFTKTLVKVNAFLRNNR